MNSVIISALIVFWGKFCHIFKESNLYRIFDKIYSSISNSWMNSFAVNRIKGVENNGLEQSFLYKIIRFPFAVCEKIGKFAGKKIENAYKNSFILNSVFSFLDNALAINTKFYGLLFLSGVLSRQIFGNFTLKLSIASALFIIVIFTDFNITDFFAESKVVNFLLSSIGFKNISWKFYNEDNLKKPSAFFLAVALGALCGMLSIKSLIMAVLPFAALAGVTLILRCPLSGVFFSVFAAPFAPTLALAALIIYTTACFIIKAIITKEFRWHIDGVGIGLGFFLIFMLISSVFSFNPKKSLLVWGLYLIFIGYYFIIINAVKTKEQLYSLVRIFVIAGLLVSIYGILQYIFGWNTSNAWIDEEMFEDSTMRAYSTMGNPNVLGEYLLLVIPLAAFLFLNSSAKVLEKMIWLASAGLCTVCMIFTQSRGCWIGLIAAVTIFVTFYKGKLWGALPILILALPFVLPQTVIDRFLSVGNMDDSSTSYRVYIWFGTIAMLRDFWLGGIGMGEGAFEIVYPIYSYNGVMALHSHSLYFQLLADGGICALLIFLVTMVAFLWKMSMLYSVKGKKNPDGVFALCSVTSIIGLMIQSMFDYTFYNYRMMAMFFMVLAISVSAVSINKVQSYTKGEDV